MHLPGSPSLAIVLGAAAVLAAGVVRAVDFEPLPFLPLQAGNTWSYEVDGSDDATEIRAELQEIGGEPAWLLFPSDDRFLDRGEYLTNDDQGLRHHGIELEIASADFTIEFDPPILLSPPTTPIPSTFDSEGDAVFHIAGLDPELPYRATSRIVGTEAVDVPAGHFDAVRLEFEIEIGREIVGQDVNLTIGSTWWLAPGVGIVRSIDEVGDESVQAELVSFQVPEPHASGLAAAAVGALLALAGWRPARR